MLTDMMLSFDCVGPPFVKMPEYLAKTGYKNPQSAVDGPFQYGHKSPLHFFEWLKANPNVLDTFNNHMMGYRQGRPSWMDPDFYPVEERLGKGFSKEENAVMLVDVGGGMGHDLEEFQSKHPNLPGRLVLQEQPVVIKDIKSLHKGIEPMEHDFYTPEPIKGELNDSQNQKSTVLIIDSQERELTICTPYYMTGQMRNVVRFFLT